MKQFSFGPQLLHVNTTNFGVYGKYENDAPDSTDSIKITFGHAKDGRMDLKRFVLGMVINQFGLPLFTEASGDSTPILDFRMLLLRNALLFIQVLYIRCALDNIKKIA